MARLSALAERHGIWIIEDAAHAFGSTYRERKIGTWGHATCFSFDPIKNITCGEGGAVVVSDDHIAERIRQMRILGMAKESWHRYAGTRTYQYEVTSQGFRYHMPNTCAAVGLVQLKKLEGFAARRREICVRYDEAIRPLHRVVPLDVNYADTVPHIYVLRVLDGQRERFMHALKNAGIDTGIHYIANHLQPFFVRHLREPLPLATRLSGEVVTLPLHCALSDDDVSRVIEAVVAFDAAG
jgi:dTDP-4-amino-4,6-dideoxygalactose transaminase